MCANDRNRPAPPRGRFAGFWEGLGVTALVVLVGLGGLATLAVIWGAVASLVALVLWLGLNLVAIPTSYAVAFGYALLVTLVLRLLGGAFARA